METSLAFNHSLPSIEKKSYNHLLKSSRYPFLSTRKTRKRFHYSIIQNYKQYDFQDFHGYAKPSRLLEATEPRVCTESLQEKEFLSYSLVRSEAIYKLKIQTSNAFGSGLSDQSAGIHLCLIDSYGDSVLQRFSIISRSNDAETMDQTECNLVHFQRGSVDEFTFKGPKLEDIAALWIGVDSGQWRLGGISLTIICPSETSLGRNDAERIHYRAFQYEFDVEDDILLGEGNGLSVVELRPRLVSDSPSIDPCDVLTASSSSFKSQSTSSLKNSKEESMRDYADLKLSLLSYHAGLILVGTMVANFSAGLKSAVAFFVGGIFGFSYLLLLQRSVDDLPLSLTVSDNNTGRIERLVRGLRRPVVGLAVAIGFIFLGLKYGSGDFGMVFTPRELLVGTMGFMAYKIAVV